MLDDVVHTLVDRVPESVETTAPGWRVAHLPDLPYPGLVADPTAEAAGRVYNDLTEHELTVLDAFENPTYVIEPLDLRTGRRGVAYVWPETAPSHRVDARRGRDSRLPRPSRSVALAV